MLNPFKTNDTIEKLSFNDIKDNCIICDTHLVSILEVSWSNLYEKKEAEAISYMNWLAKVINELWYPIQLISQSRPKSFDSHIRALKNNLKKNDYNLKFKKDLEWFELYYDTDYKNWKITKDEIKEEYDKAPEYIERSMLKSYIERLNDMVENNNILENKYYFVISTLDQPIDISEKKEEKYTVMNFNKDEVFDSFKNKLEERTKHTLSVIRENSWMIVARKHTTDLKNIMFDYLNFPLSHRHKINDNITEYWKVPPLLDNSIVNKNSYHKEKAFILRQWESIINYLIWKLAQKEVWNVNPDSSSNNINQLLKPSSIDDSEMHYLQINDSYTYTIHINRFWDDYLEDLVLWPILTLPYYYDLSVHLISLNKEIALLEFKKKKQRIEQDFEERKKKKSLSVIEFEKDKAQEQLSKIWALESDLRNKYTWLYSTSIDITFRASTLEELETIKDKVKEKLSSKRIFFSEATWNHLSWLISTAPLLTNRIAWYGKIFEKNLETLQQITHYYPFCPDSITSDKWLALWISRQWSWDDEVRNIEFFDYFDRTRILNSIMLIVWQSGSWKTTQAHQLFRNQELLGNRHLIIDFLWNYIKWAKDTPDKYRVIKIDATSSDKINPCDIIFPSNKYLSGSENYKGLELEEIKERIIDDKISELSAYFKMFLEDEYWPKTRWILDKATKNTYIEKLQNIDISEVKYYWDLMLSDIINTLLNEKDKDRKIISKDVASMLEPYATWSYSWMFNSKTNIKMDNRSIVFYLRWNNSEKYKELAILQSFLMVKKIAYSSKNNILAIDELHEIMRIKSTEIQNFIRSQIATIRNLDWGVLWMTQFLDQILTTQAGIEFFKLATTKLYLAWWLSSSDDQNSVLNYEKSLSNSSKSYLLNNNRPGYWVLMLWQEQIHVKIDNHPDVSMYERYKPPKD